VLKKKIWANFQRIIELFTKKIVKKLLKIWSWDPGSGIRDPGSGIRKKPIPDPGSRGQKAPNPGSRIRIRNTEKNYITPGTAESLKVQAKIKISNFLTDNVACS
jgi:hypothetical protein